MKVVISSGHAFKVRGASDLIDEVSEARRVVEKVAYYLRQMGVQVDEFHDNTSTNQNSNLHTIVNYHNSKTRDLDVSVHFNAASRTDAPRGTEVFYYNGSAEGKAKAESVSQAIAITGEIKNRGAKNGSLFFTRETSQTAILIEVCFVDSVADVEAYHKNFDAICRSIAESIAGKRVTPPPTQVHKKEDDIMSQKFEPSNQAIRDAVSRVLLRFQSKEPELAEEWRVKANKGELSISDAIGLLYVAHDRGYFNGK